MQGNDKERFLQLCEQASTEQNPDVMLTLVREINEMLEKKRVRLSGMRNVLPEQTNRSASGS
jgi:hypothetical protein